MSNYPKIPYTASDSAHKEKFLTDILYRKEFYQFKIDPTRNFRDPNEGDPLRNSFLKIQSHQLFCSNFINPNTPYKRLFVMHQTGTGKTLVAISIAQVFIKVFAEIYKLAAVAAGTSMRSYAEIDKTTPSVFIFGFTKSNIIREILKFPEFGFITIQERDELDKLQKLANAGMPADVKRYKEFYGNLKRRITNKRTGGFYKFFGYQELVNRLFISNEVNLVDLEIIANQRLRNMIAKKKMEKRRRERGELHSQSKNGVFGGDELQLEDNLTTNEVKPDENPDEKPETIEITDEEIAEASIQYGSALEDIIKEYIDAGKIHINKELLEQFNNSLIICDEVHNIYNSSMKNNYGVAIQYILDYNPNIRAVFLSATPMNNSPTEIVDVLNLLQPASAKIHKSDLFVSGKQFTPDALDKIEKLFFGRVSFIQDLNPKYMPTVDFIGTPRELLQPIDYGGAKSEAFEKGTKFPANISPASTAQNSIGVIKQIPYLVFEQCPMSEKHMSAYIKYLIETKQLISHEYTDFISDNQPIDLKQLNLRNFRLVNPRNVTIGTEARSIFDLVYPTGVFKTSELRSLQSSANEEILAANNIKIVKSSNNAYTIAGDWLTRENIGEYSGKYKRLLDNIFAVFAEVREELEKNSSGAAPETFARKHMIYHDKVRNSGVLQIQEILKANGFIDEKSEAVETTICAICGIAFSEHKTESNVRAHKFYPARFVMAHSDIDKKIIENSIIKFNAPENTYGLEYWGLVGSKLISEGYDMKDVREFSIMSSPIDISTLRQTLGRCVRKNSHINLLPNQRNVKIRLYISVLSDEGNTPRINTPDEYRYVDKLTDYYFMQAVENRAYKSAIDADIHFDIISRGMLVPESMPTNETSSMNALGDLPPITERRLGPIPYRPILDLKTNLSLSELNTLTFDAYGHNKEEIKTIIYIIKRLFLLRPVWTYATLWEATQAPPFGVEYNPKLFAERNFIIALNGLISKLKVFISGESIENLSQLGYGSMTKETSAALMNTTVAGKMLIKSLFDKDESYIYGFGDIFNDAGFNTDFMPSNKIGLGDSEVGESRVKDSIMALQTTQHIYPLPFGKKYKIEHIANYYILFPVAEKSIIDFSSSMSSTEKVVVKKRTALTTIVEQEKELPIIDIESYIRPINYGTNISIDIEEYMKGMKNQFTYDMQYSLFAKKFFKEKSRLPAVDIIGEYSPEFFHNLLSDIIATEVEFTISGDLKEFHKTKKGKVHAEILSIFDKFKSIIYLSDVIEHDDVVKKITDMRILQFKTLTTKGEKTEDAKLKFSVLLPKTTPIGFIGKGAIYVYGSNDHNENVGVETTVFGGAENAVFGSSKPKKITTSGEFSGWFRLSKNALTGVAKNYVENPGGYVGYYEASADGAMKFKIRKSINSGSVKASVMDIRFVERGIVCATKGKKEIISVLNAMKIDIDKEVKNIVRSGVYPDVSDENGKPKIKYLCKIVELSLINSEIKERAKNSNMKYLYMWYEDPISVNMASRGK